MRRTHTARKRRKFKRLWRKKTTRHNPTKYDLRTEAYKNTLGKIGEPQS